MKEKIGVYLYSLNASGKHHHQYFEMRNMIEVGRFLITYHSPRGYELVRVEIQDAEQMEFDLEG